MSFTSTKEVVRLANQFMLDYVVSTGVSEWTMMRLHYRCKDTKTHTITLEIKEQFIDYPQRRTVFQTLSWTKQKPLNL